MAQAVDYALDSNLDLQISQGDFLKGYSDQVASILILNSYLGSWKFHPFCGMGIKRYEGSSNTQGLMKREIIVQHEADGMRVNAIHVKDFTFSLDIIRPGYE